MEEIDWNVVAAVASAIAAIASAVVTLVALSVAHWTRRSARVIDAYHALVAPEVVAARFYVGQASRETVLNREEKQRFTDAAFRVMWAVQESVLANDTIKKTSIAPVESKLLYQHLHTILPDLGRAISKHGDGIDWQPTLSRTNELIEALPAKITNSWQKTIERKKGMEALLDPNRP